MNYNSATINWNSINGNDEVFYNIYLNRSLVGELITDLNYSFTSLTENTNYVGKVETIILDCSNYSSSLKFDEIYNN